MCKDGACGTFTDDEPEFVISGHGTPPTLPQIREMVARKARETAERGDADAAGWAKLNEKLAASGDEDLVISAGPNFGAHENEDMWYKFDA